MKFLRNYINSIGGVTLITGTDKVKCACMDCRDWNFQIAENCNSSKNADQRDYNDRGER